MLDTQLLLDTPLMKRWSGGGQAVVIGNTQREGF